MISESTRSLIFKRDSYRCRYCGSGRNLHIDHVFASARGGSDDIGNLVTACRRCNLKKSDSIGIFPYPIGYFSPSRITRFARWIQRLLGRRRFIPELEFTPAILAVAQPTPIPDLYSRMPAKKTVLGFDSWDLFWLCELLAKDDIVNKRQWGLLPLPFSKDIPKFEDMEDGELLARWQAACVSLGIVEGWEKGNAPKALIRNEYEIYNRLCKLDGDLGI